MNPVFQVAAETAEHAWIMGVMTALFLVCFLGWAWWAYHPHNKEKLERAGRMPLMEDEDE